MSRHARTARLVARGMGGVYAVAFTITLLQDPGLIGPDGILPATWFLERARLAVGDEAMWRLPTLFWWVEPTEAALRAVSGLGLGLALLTLWRPSALSFAAMWALYLSLVGVGQRFTGFAWESLLLEAGALSVFLVPLLPRGRLEEPPAVVLWLWRWLALRLMLGAGLIKLRGDACWRDLSCLQHHYETQPNPHVGSWLLHQAPDALHTLGVLVNHGAELILPWFLLAPWRVRRWATLGLVVFQALLIGSGNLAWLNWLTLVICLSGLDDRAWTDAQRLWRRLATGRPPPSSQQALPPGRRWRAVAWTFAVVVAWRSAQPVENLLSAEQVMNTAYDPLRLVNTYGAFGSVGQVREEITLEGTLDDPADPAATWVAYTLPCKPGPVERAPCWVTPYHLRLDWQLWFVPLTGVERQPWLLHLLWRLLHAEPVVLGLFSEDPFDGARPRAVRVRQWRYRFTAPGEPGWWSRDLNGELVRPVTADDPELQRALRGLGFGRTLDPPGGG